MNPFRKILATAAMAGFVFCGGSQAMAGAADAAKPVIGNQNGIELVRHGGFGGYHHGGGGFRHGGFYGGGFRHGGFYGGGFYRGGGYGYRHHRRYYGYGWGYPYYSYGWGYPYYSYGYSYSSNSCYRHCRVYHGPRYCRVHWRRYCN